MPSPSKCRCHRTSAHRLPCRCHRAVRARALFQGVADGIARTWERFYSSGFRYEKVSLARNKSALAASFESHHLTPNTGARAQVTKRPHRAGARIAGRTPHADGIRPISSRSIDIREKRNSSCSRQYRSSGSSFVTLYFADLFGAKIIPERA